MRKLSFSLAAAFFLSAPHFVSAEISFLLQADTLRDASGTAVDIGQGSWALVADTNMDGFGSVEPGTVAASDFIGADDQIVARGSFWFVNGTIQQNPTGLTLGGDWGAGDPLALVWFPSAGTSPSSVAAGEEYGFYTSLTGEDDSSAWITPADGIQNYVLEIITTDGGTFGPGSVSPASATAGLTVIPEPSAAFLAFLSGALFLRRRR